MYSDVISEMLIKMKNAQMVKKDTVEVFHSKMKEAILKILKQKGFISDYQVEEKRKNVKVLKIFLKYDPDGNPVIRGVKRVSKPSRRVYESVKDIKPIYNGYAVSIYSTNKGIMTGKDAIENNVGGEFLFYIW